jgi:hypothetical protein
MNDETIKAFKEALDDISKNFQEVQAVILDLKSSGAPEADLKSALVEAGCGGVSVDKFLAAKTLEEMLDCMKSSLLPEDN